MSDIILELCGIIVRIVLQNLSKKTIYIFIWQINTILMYTGFCTEKNCLFQTKRNSRLKTHRAEFMTLVI